eukprot:3731019-Pleurochrysis_carterae.AAC.1
MRPIRPRLGDCQSVKEEYHGAAVSSSWISCIFRIRHPLTAAKLRLFCYVISHHCETMKLRVGRARAAKRSDASNDPTRTHLALIGASTKHSKASTRSLKSHLQEYTQPGHLQIQACKRVGQTHVHSRKRRHN